MTSPTPSSSVAERDKIMLLREGYRKGVGEAHACYNRCRHSKRDEGLYDWMPSIDAPGLVATEVDDFAAKAFPLPPIRRPLRGTFYDARRRDGSRVEAWWNAADSRIEYGDGSWDFLSAFAKHCPNDPDDFALLGRMLSGETETVEDQ